DPARAGVRRRRDLLRRHRRRDHAGALGRPPAGRRRRARADHAGAAGALLRPVLRRDAGQARLAGMTSGGAIRADKLRALTLLLVGRWSAARGTMVADLLAETVREHRDLTAEERAALRDAFYRIVGSWRRLAFALRTEAPSPLALWLAAEVDS